METKANYVLVGIFTLAICMASFFFVYWMARYGESRDTAKLEIRIQGSVTGLSVGSQVLFNGIKVGDVRRLFIDQGNPDVVIAETEISRSTPITRSTKASLGFQGLTGQAYVELNGGKANEPNLLDEAEKDEAIARIDADPSAVNNLLQMAQDIFSRIESVMVSLEKFIDETREPLVDTVKNTKQFTDALAQNTHVIDELGKSAGDVSKVISDAREMMARLNAASVRVDSVLTKVDGLLSSGGDGVVGEARETLKSFKQVADTLNARLGPITDNLSRFSGQGLRDVEALVSESRRSISRIERAISDIERDPQRLIFGGQGTVPQYDGRQRR
ncbi:MAG: MlaD family protein [Phyllobacterium sp.]